MKNLSYRVFTNTVLFSIITLCFLLCGISAIAQKHQITCETDSALVSCPDIKIVKGEFSSFPQSPKLVFMAQKKGYRPRTAIITNTELKKQKVHSVPALTKMPSSDDLGKFILLDEVDYSKDSITTITRTERNKKLKFDTVSVYKNSVFKAFPSRYKTQEILTDMSLTDTVDHKGEFVNQYSYLSLGIKIIDVNFHEEFVARKGLGQNTTLSYLYSAGVIAEYTLTDNYDKKIYSVKIDSKSIDRLRSGLSFYAYYSYSQKGLESNTDLIWDALEEGLTQFLNDPNLISEIKLRQNESAILESRPTIKINLPKIAASGIKDFLAGTVTLSLKDSHGSGVVVSNDGYIVSNYHVVGRDSTIDVITNSGDTLIGKVIRIDPEFDLALIKIPVVNQMAFNIWNGTKPVIGSDVYALGTPVDISLGQSITAGIVSAHRNFFNHEYYQTDARVSGGSSGGALVNDKGQLLGIVSSKIKGLGVEGIGFAIPAKYIQERLKISIQ